MVKDARPHLKCETSYRLKQARQTFIDKWQQYKNLKENKK